MYQPISVAVDGSHTPRLALEEAIKRAKEQESQRRIARVVDAAMTLTGDAGLFVNIDDLESALVESGQ
jgi:nucleotide-binding universal stress UspA family protein